ncbi:MAG: type VI secretion system baseplate subunit TssK [Desulfamplus sp.]|nr:type VI secretion system baseplate subunit TssK [Desulfamplus sp.]
MKSPVFWTDGDILHAQHFQREDRYIQSLFQPFYKYLMPYFWGIGNIELSGNSSSGAFIENGEFIFPDHSYVSVPHNAIVPHFNLKNIEFMDESVSFFLALRKWEENGKNVTVLPDLEDCSNVDTRFVTCKKAENVTDLYVGESQAKLKSLFFVLRLFEESALDEDIRNNYTYIPIKFERDGDGIRLSKYVPPCLTISAFPFLSQCVQEITEKIKGCISRLKQKKNDSSEYLILTILNRYFSSISHLTGQGHIHPYLVYGELKKLAAELSSFSNQSGLFHVTEYKHEDIFKCFSEVKYGISNLLNEVVTGKKGSVEFRYVINLEPDFSKEDDRSYYLVCKSDRIEHYIQQIEQAFVGAKEDLEHIIRHGKSMRLKHIEKQPGDMPKKDGEVWFEIKGNRKRWDNVINNQNIAFYCYSNELPFDDLKIKLIMSEFCNKSQSYTSLGNLIPTL